MISQKEIEKKVDQSKFVFIGTVKKIGASNLAELEASDRLVLVEINKVANAPEAFVGTVGTTVTVKIPSRIKLKNGETKLFFTNRLMYGENLAVEAVAVEQVEKDHTQIVQDIKNAVMNIERKEQLARITSAELIVEGEVTKMEQSEINKHYPIAFRSPKWVAVTIRVDRIIKGKYSGKTIEVLYSTGSEVEDSQPFEINIGKTGVWLLRKQKLLKDKKIETEYYIVLEDEDFLRSYEYVALINPNLS